MMKRFDSMVFSADGTGAGSAASLAAPSAGGAAAVSAELAGDLSAAAAAAADGATALRGQRPNQSAEKLFSQDDLDRVVRERLEREKSARERSALKAKEEAEAEGLKAKQEWQALAEVKEKQAAELSARLALLEPVNATAERYRGALEKYLEAEKKDMPKHVLVLLEKLDPVDQIEYLAQNREVLKPASARGAAGVPASPDPKERTLSEEEQERARRGQASLYSSF